MVYINVKKYEHYNRSFKNWDSPRGRYISSRAGYEKALREEGMMTETEARKMGMVDPGEKVGKEYKVSKDTMDLIRSVESTADKKGNINPGDVAIDKLKSLAKYNRDALPKSYQDVGGIE